MEAESCKPKVDPLSSEGLYAEVENAFQMYDKNGDGVLSLEECSEYLKGWCKRRGLNED